MFEMIEDTQGDKANDSVVEQLTNCPVVKLSEDLSSNTIGMLKKKHLFKIRIKVG